MYLDNVKFIILNNHKYILNELDNYRILTNDYIIRRYLNKHGNVNKAIEIITELFVWKYKYGIYMKTDYYFPRELWKYWYNVCGKDKHGRLIIWNFSSKLYQFYKYTWLYKLVQEFMVHLVEKITNDYQNEKFIMVDCWYNKNAMNIRSSDIQFSSKLNTLYPNLIDMAIIVDMPMVMRKIANLLNIIFKINKFIFLNRDELKSFIDLDVIPKHLGGNRIISDEEFKDFITLREYGNLFGIPSNDLDRIYNFI